jgi:hypothetical protein
MVAFRQARTAAGGTFTMTEPFEFSIDPRALLDEEEA